LGWFFVQCFYVCLLSLLKSCLSHLNLLGATYKVLQTRKKRMWTRHNYSLCWLLFWHIHIIRHSVDRWLRAELILSKKLRLSSALTVLSNIER
jgi:hypothetical protein